MACRREGIAPEALLQPGRPASSTSVTDHAHGFGSRVVPRHPRALLPHPADDPALEDGDPIRARWAIGEGAPPGDARAVHRPDLREIMVALVAVGDLGPMD